MELNGFLNLNSEEMLSIQANCRNIILNKYLKEKVLLQYSELI